MILLRRIFYTHSAGGSMLIAGDTPKITIRRESEAVGNVKREDTNAGDGSFGVRPTR